MDIQALLCEPTMVGPLVVHEALKPRWLHAALVPKPPEREHLEDLLLAARSILLSHTKDPSHAVLTPRITLASCASSNAGNSDTSNRGQFFVDTSQFFVESSSPRTVVSAKKCIHAPCSHNTAHIDGAKPAGASSFVEDVNVSVVLFPRRKAGSATEPRAPPVKLGFDVLAPLFGLPQSAAAKSIGVSLTALKQVCRKLGLERWPYRRTSKSNSLHKISHKAGHASNLQHRALSSSGSAESIVTQSPCLSFPVSCVWTP